ncbi:MAG: alanine racemase, partial [Clostridia bacterium]|nr:alanine racemase [Clostridia bacterium]
IAEKLTVAIDDVEAVKALETEAKRQNTFVKVHVAVNTGMNRSGVNFGDLNELLLSLKKAKRIIVDGVFSHLYKPEDKRLRACQVAVFKSSERLVKSYFPLAVAHLSASGGFLKGEDFDGVRAGILLYGYYPFPVKRPRAVVKPAMKVVTRVIKVRSLSSGERILYGGESVKTAVKSGLIRFGYADGLPRKGVNGMLNNRCMDVSAVKIDEKVKNFYILNKNADKIAQLYDTINYEVLTGVARRAEKIYLR